MTYEAQFAETVVIYPNAGHAFFAVDRQQYRVQAALDGWKKVFEWFGKYLR